MVLQCVSCALGGESESLTVVVSQLELGKVVANHPVVGVVAAVVCRPSLLSRPANALHLIRLGRAKVLSWRGPGAARVLWVAVLVVLVDFAIELLGEVADPLGHRLLCLLEALLDVLADLWEVICSVCC